MVKLFKNESDAQTPMGRAIYLNALFPNSDINAYLAIGVTNGENWTCFMVGATWAECNLSEVTLLAADGGNGVFTDDRMRDWYCYEYGSEAALLAWDWEQLLVTYPFCPGIAVFAQSDSERRQWCEDVILASEGGVNYLYRYERQFEGSQDAPMNFEDTPDPLGNIESPWWEASILLEDDSDSRE